MYPSMRRKRTLVGEHHVAVLAFYGGGGVFRGSKVVTVIGGNAQTAFMTLRQGWVRFHHFGMCKVKFTANVTRKAHK